MPPFRTVLIANRGEIAVRIARTLREMGIRSIAVASEADRKAPHVAACDECIVIGPAAATESYLRIPAILEAARSTRADAIHPGYGFLSQNAAFAAACAAQGIVFIGPTPDAMRLMANKIDSRITAERAGVPVIPGTGELPSAAEAETAATRIGFPLLLKAAAGGGGKGMRRVSEAVRVSEEFAAVRREAESAFGDGRILLEKQLSPVRHIEVQVMADTHGGVYALGERDCTLQRRFQKIIEESPSPVVNAALRSRLCEAAVRLARAAGYVNAGTVEFLLDANGHFYFLEMNTRLQVEHPVTELTRGLDLVRLQIEVAQGSRLALADKPPQGHAIEARLYAEDPDRHFLPSSGRILRLIWPEGIRIDHGIAEGMDVTPYYDPLLAKLIATGPDRESARQNLLQALRSTVLLGLPTNLNYLIALLETREFREADLATDRLPELPSADLPAAVWAAALAGRIVSTRRAPSPWDRLGRWRVGG